MTNGVSKDYGLPQLTDEQLEEFMRQHIDYGVVWVKYQAGAASVLKHDDVYQSEPKASPCPEGVDIESSDEWRPIETAPKDGTRVHLGFANMQNFDVIGHWESRFGHWAHGSLPQDKFYGRPEPTHWMPLPEAPQVNRS